MKDIVDIGTLKQVTFLDWTFTPPFRLKHLTYADPILVDRQIVSVEDAKGNIAASAYYTAPANPEDEALLLALCEARYTG